MTKKLGDFSVIVDALLGDATEKELSGAERKGEILAAIRRYSVDAPDEITEDVTGDGGKYYAISNLTKWSEGLSRVKQIQYPAEDITADERPVYLDEDDWDDDYWESTTRYLFLPNHSPAATETMRIRYTALYTPTAGVYDTPEVDFDAICHLAAGLCCLAISTRYARTSGSPISIDSADHSGRSSRFRDAAKDFFKLYDSHMDKKNLAGTGKGEKPDPGSEFLTIAEEHRFVYR